MSSKSYVVMPRLDPGIHDFSGSKTWMAGTKPGHDEVDSFS
jgi:hypothetical protein